jgi:hypothetical protein
MRLINLPFLVACHFQACYLKSIENISPIISTEKKERKYCKAARQVLQQKGPRDGQLSKSIEKRTSAINKTVQQQKNYLVLHFFIDNCLY